MQSVFTSQPHQKKPKLTRFQPTNTLQQSIEDNLHSLEKTPLFPLHTSPRSIPSVPKVEPDLPWDSKILHQGVQCQTSVQPLTFFPIQSYPFSLSTGKIDPLAQQISEFLWCLALQSPEQKNHLSLPLTMPMDLKTYHLKTPEQFYVTVKTDGVACLVIFHLGYVYEVERGCEDKPLRFTGHQYLQRLRQYETSHMQNQTQTQTQTSTLSPFTAFNIHKDLYNGTDLGLNEFRYSGYEKQILTNKGLVLVCEKIYNRHPSSQDQCVYSVHDILGCDGYSYVQLPMWKRKTLMTYVVNTLNQTFTTGGLCVLVLKPLYSYTKFLTQMWPKITNAHNESLETEHLYQQDEQFFFQVDGLILIKKNSCYEIGISEKTLKVKYVKTVDMLVMQIDIKQRSLGLSLRYPPPLFTRFLPPPNQPFTLQQYAVCSYGRLNETLTKQGLIKKIRQHFQPYEHSGSSNQTTTLLTTPNQEILPIFASFEQREPLYALAYFATRGYWTIVAICTGQTVSVTTPTEMMSLLMDLWQTKLREKTPDHFVAMKRTLPLTQDFPLPYPSAPQKNRCLWFRICGLRKNRVTLAYKFDTLCVMSKEPYLLLCWNLLQMPEEKFNLLLQQINKGSKVNEFAFDAQTLSLQYFRSRPNKKVPNFHTTMIQSLEALASKSSISDVYLFLHEASVQKTTLKKNL